MSRSAAEAARPTSTTPLASFTVNKNGSRKSPSQMPGPARETPQEKVRRLKAAAERARQAQMSGIDRWIARGRVWADVAHTITATTLIAATFIAGGVTIYALTDMIIYNRKKKAQFFEEQKARIELALHTSRKAIQDGIATEEQINFVKMQDEHQKSLQAKEQKQSMFSKSKEWLFYGLKKDEFDDEDRDDGNHLIQDRNLGTKGFSATNIDNKPSTITSKAKMVFTQEREQLAETESTRIKDSRTESSRENEPTSGSWTSWIFRR